jgi:hypothetical protein
MNMNVVVSALRLIGCWPGLFGGRPGCIHA